MSEKKRQPRHRNGGLVSERVTVAVWEVSLLLCWVCLIYCLPLVLLYCDEFVFHTFWFSRYAPAAIDPVFETLYRGAITLLMRL